MTPELPKQYDPAAAQEKWSKFWDEQGFFHSKPNPDKKPYTIVIPPPNVTEALHLGYALNNTLQDIMIRMKRIQGFETLWVPGVDHAGIVKFHTRHQAHKKVDMTKRFFVSLVPWWLL